jgi:hypothetical protein
MDADQTIPNRVAQARMADRCRCADCAQVDRGDRFTRAVS